MDRTNVLNMFNAYQNGVKRIGVTAEVTLPEFEFKSESIEAAGLMGTVDAVAVGHTDAIEQEIPFINADDDFFNSLMTGQNVSMTLRGSQQVTDSATGTIKNVPVRVVLSGIVKKIKLGSLKQAGLGNPSFTLSLNYYLHEFNGQKRIEIDKLNSVCVINGNDLMAEINSQC